MNRNVEEGDDLRLYGNVERRDGLVGNDQFGVDGYAAGDGDALALPAGDLGGELVAVAGVQPDKRKQLVHFGPHPALIWIQAIDDQGFRNDVGDLHARVQGRRGVLKDDLHVALDIFLVLPVGALFRDQEALEVNLAFRRGINAHDGARHRRFAAAGFPDQPEDFPPAQVEGNPVDGAHRQGLVDGEMLLVIPDG